MLTYEYADTQKTVIAASDGRSIPCDPKNTDYAALVASGVVIGGYIPAAVTIPKRYSKAALFAAMTDAEYATFSAVQSQQPARERAIFEHATEIAEDHALFPKFDALLRGAYGGPRAIGLLNAARI